MEDFMFVEFKYEPLIEDFYADGEMKIESVLKILENAGNRHSDLAGNHNIEGSSNGMAWILTDWYVEMDFLPKYGSSILAKTWSQGATSIFGTSRDFEFYCDGKICGKGTTRWVLYDIQSSRPKKIEQDLIEKYGPEKLSVFGDAKLPKISVPESFSNEISLKPRRSDIDFNSHVHNLVYIDYAMETLPDGVYMKHDFRKIRINYKAAVKEGEEIVARYAELDGGHTICIFGCDGSLKTSIRIN